MYGFDSVNDVYYPRIAQSWTELGLGGAPLKARVPVPTSSKTHRLLTTMNIGDPARSHLRTITDATPTDSDGTPVFEPTWRWMLERGLAGTTGRSPVG